MFKPRPFIFHPGFVLTIILLLLISDFKCHAQQVNGIQTYGGLTEEETKIFVDECSAGIYHKNEFVSWVAIAQALSIAGHYAESNKCFEGAYVVRLDQLNKIIGKKEESFDDLNEMFMLLYFKALNYLQLGDKDNALVECRRIEELTRPLNNHDTGSNLLTADPLVHAIMGLLYEVDDEYSNASISYHRAKALFEVDYKNLLSKKVPDQINFGTDQMDLLSEYCPWSHGCLYRPPGGQLLLIWHNGRIPQKFLEDRDFKVMVTDKFRFCGDERTEVTRDYFGNLLLPFFTFTVPTYVSCQLIRDNESFKCELLEDVTWFSVRTLQTRLNANGIHVWRKGINWSTLPSSIYYSIVPLKPGINNFEFVLQDEGHGSVVNSFAVEGDGKLHLKVVTTLESRTLRKEDEVIALGNRLLYNGLAYYPKTK